MDVKFILRKSFFTESRQRIFEAGALYAETFVYPTGIQALVLGNDRGHVTLLPYMGQMVWDAVFDGQDLTMENMFSAPRPANQIVETYGCYLYHSGLLRNGCPGPDDTHALHGEMPCAPMDTAELIVGEDERGPFLRLAGSYEYVMGFGDHYRATPSVTLHKGLALMDVVMAVENLGAVDMELMYMCHTNPAFETGAELIQPCTDTPENIVTRTSIPGHVHPTQNWMAFLNQVKENPSAMAVLDEPEKYDPEFVFFLKNLRQDDRGMVHTLMKLTDGSAQYLGYAGNAFSHLTRWILKNDSQGVAAFALPGTCEPEGYTAEKAKGNVRILSPKEKAVFRVQAGRLSADEARRIEKKINELKEGE